MEEEEDNIIVKWVHEDVETSYNLLNKINLFVCMCECVWLCVCVGVCVYIYIYIYIYIHTYIYIYNFDLFATRSSKNYLVFSSMSFCLLSCSNTRKAKV